MKKIKRTLAIMAWICAVGLLAFACYDDLDVHQAYSFDLVTMPVPKKVKEGETIEIRCKLVREGNYRDTEFTIRYFQEDGYGVLKTEEGTVFQPNDLYPLAKSVFRLYYTSFSEEQSVFTVYIEDSFGQVIEKTFSFQNESTKEATGEEKTKFLLLFPDVIQKPLYAGF